MSEPPGVAYNIEPDRVLAVEDRIPDASYMAMLTVQIGPLSFIARLE
jgi:hypothetical protein